ncbi:MAG: hypothetical protein IPL73_11155 [Candidatus Obscuribacter sp.]|nr:hypothetical protein [Candidatus Obscuribacter sp.]
MKRGIRKKKGSDAALLESLDPVPGEKSARLKDAPIGLLETTIDSLEELITEYCDRGRVDSSRFTAHSYSYKKCTAKQMPNCFPHYKIYGDLQGRSQRRSCLTVIEWMRSI